MLLIHTCGRRSHRLARNLICARARNCSSSEACVSSSNITSILNIDNSLEGTLFLLCLSLQYSVGECEVEDLHFESGSPEKDCFLVTPTCEGGSPL